MKKHFHTFDALRFIAFLKVFLLHLPIVAFPIFNFFRKGGGIGVIFFFVLSGFLITYIILEEKIRTNKLNLYHFYLRRILRIWPLYFLMVGFAFATPYILNVIHLPYSNEGYEPNWWMTMSFLENYKVIATNSHPNVSPLNVIWSLCIEEHFYLLWGIILFAVNVRRMPIVIFVSITISTIVNVIFVKNNILNSEILTNLCYFAFGAIPAYLLAIKKDDFELFIAKIPRFWKWFLISIIIGYVVLSPNISYNLKDYIEPILFGSLFCFILCLIIPSNSSIRISDKNIFSKLGILTYGLYMFHSIVINLFIQIFKMAHLTLEKPINALIFIIITLAITIIVCQLSYILFEKPFLKLKTYFY